MLLTAIYIGGGTDVGTQDTDASVAESSDGERGAGSRASLVEQVDVAAVYWILSPVHRAPDEAVGLADLQARRVEPDRLSVGATKQSTIEAIICAPRWSWDCGWAIATVACESSFDMVAYNPAGPYHGWWQTILATYDPWENTAEAHRQYLEYVGPDAWRTESPWPGCPRR